MAPQVSGEDVGIFLMPSWNYFVSKGWFFWSPEDVRDKVNALAAKGYENEPAIITAKILMRERHGKPKIGCHP